MKTISVLIILLGLLPTLSAQHPLPTRSVAIFKNGTAFVIRSGEVSPVDGRFRLGAEYLPPAKFGTVWLSSPDASITAVTTQVDTIEKTRDAFSWVELLKSNLGKEVQLQVKDDRSVSGTLHQAGHSMVVVHTEGATEFIPTNSVTHVMVFGEAETQTTERIAERSMQVQFDRPRNAPTLDLMYLRDGLAWFPQYRIDLTGEKSGHLHFRAQIANDAEDITDSELNVVVGVPNFSFANMPDPLFFWNDIEGFVNRFQPNNPNRGFMQNRADMAMPAMAYDQESSGTGMPAPPVDLQGESMEDLYYYRIPNVTIPAGGRAMYTIFSRDLKLEHIYESRLPANGADRYAYQEVARPMPQEVEHKLKLYNESSEPFTTGSAMVFREDDGEYRPISQDKLTYTAPGSHSYLTLTTAPDVEVRHKEEESSRQENAKRENKVQYDLVQVAGEVIVANRKDKAIRLDVRRRITGELGTSSETWLKARQVSFSTGLNPVTEVCWELELDPGEELTIEYQYEIYVR